MDAPKDIDGLANRCNKPLCHTSNGNNWTRTSGLSIISRMLYQLSYVSWPRKVELNYRHHVLQTCALPSELFPEIQKVGFEPTSSPPQTVPSTTDLLLDDSLNGT